ncbi:MAG: enoyl-CoA hydratase-related protein, partial [Acidobacteriota bacterium]
YVIDYALQHGYRFEEVDAITGPLIGRPKTGTFRLQDLVGIDVSAFVGKNLYELIPTDPAREVLRSPRVETLIGGLVERGRLGNKTKAGFYRKSKGPGGKPVFEVLSPETFDYEAQQKVAFEAVEAVAKIRDLGERVRTLCDERHAADRGSQLAWAATSQLLGYAADVAKEIAYDVASIDNAIRWGFAYELGPFELWDRLGVAATVERMENGGFEVADWVKEMLFAEIDSFYRVEDGVVTGCYDWQIKRYADVASDEHHITLGGLRAAAEPVASNGSASLHDLGDGVLLLEFHSKMNAIDDDLIAMVLEAGRQLENDAYYGLVIGNDGPNFSVGANLKGIGQAALAGELEGIGKSSGAFQQALQGLRYSAKPVVAAVHGMALGGGAEVALAASRIVAHAESYIGLVEAGVGLLPGGGGLKELVRRQINPAMQVKDADPLPLAQKVLETVAMAKTSTSAAEAKELGFLGPHDRIVMHRDHLLYEAKQEVLAMVADGYRAPSPLPVYAGGRDLLAALQMIPWSMQQAGYASEHDALVANKIAFVIAGGDLSSPGWATEDYFLSLESEAFVELAGTEKTQARIRHMLETGKPLRN